MTIWYLGCRGRNGKAMWPIMYLYTHTSARLSSSDSARHPQTNTIYIQRPSPRLGDFAVESLSSTSWASRQLKMANFANSLSTTRSEPNDRYRRNIYHVQQDGITFCRPDVLFSGNAPEASSRGVKQTMRHFVSTIDWLWSMYFTTISYWSPWIFMTYWSGRQLPYDTMESQAGDNLLLDKPPGPIPSFFTDQMRRACPHCHCKSGLLWRNLWSNRAGSEEYFDSYFRYLMKKVSR